MLLKKHGQVLITFLYLNDILIIALSWVLAYYIRFYSGFYSTEGVPPAVRHYLFVLPFIAMIWPSVFNLSKLYLPKRNISLWVEFLGILKANILASFILLGLNFFLYREYSYSRIVFFLFFFLNLFLLVISRVIFRHMLRYLRRKGYNLKHVLIVGAGNMGKQVSHKVASNPWTGFNLVGWIDDYKEVGEEIEGKKVLGKCTDIRKCIAEKDVDQVFIALPARAYKRLFYLIKKLEAETVDVRIVPNIYHRVVTLNASIESFDGLPTINLVGSPIYGWNRAIKRLFDIAVALMALVISAPIMIVAAILIKLTSPGPVLFQQTRYGLGGKTINIYKLRSMYVHDRKVADTTQASRNDSRITPIGKFMRHTSIDELPQLFNVLSGEMSIVGPRPHPRSLDNKNKRLLETYMWRYKVKPGMTGWAQVNGWRGRTDTLEKMKRRVEHDIYYIKHWSPWFDIRIMWLTIWKGMINKNAY